MMLGLLLLLPVAVLNWLAVAKGWKIVEYIAKPATMILLFGWLALVGGFGSVPLVCFGLGILFSLAGDIFLILSFYRLSNRWFMFGLVAFLLAHVAYIVGFNIPLPNVSLLWALGLAFLLALTARRVLGRILAELRQKGLPRLVIPIAVYGITINIMLLSALLTFYRADWGTAAAGLAGLGALLFYFSDIILAWNKFVTPIKKGRVINMILYHLGQVGLIVGAVLQFRG